jgi:hypothetical protein
LRPRRRVYQNSVGLALAGVPLRHLEIADDLIEGKRTETVSDSTVWFPGRNLIDDVRLFVGHDD